MSSGKTFTYGTTLLSGLQILGRVVPFLLSLWVARTVPEAVLGASIIHLQFLQSLVLFLTREAFRKSCARSTPTDSYSEKNVSMNAVSAKEQESPEIEVFVNVSWLVLPIGFVLSLFFFGAALLWNPAGDMPNNGFSKTEYYHALAWILIGCMLELAAEPMFLINRRLLYIERRVVAEGLGMFTRSLISVVNLMFFHGSLVGFALSHTGNAIVLFLVLILSFPLPRRRLIPRFRQWRDAEWKLFQLIQRFFVQGISQFVLSEGEKLVVMALLDLKSQGVFAIVSNIGSLIPRLLFQPGEEMAFTLFARYSVSGPQKNVSISAQTTKKLSKQSGDPLLQEKAGKARPEIEGENVLQLRNLYVYVTKFSVFVGLGFCICGIPSTSAVLTILYGSPKGSDLLSVFLLCVLFMAPNGITEAFLHARVDEGGVHRLSVHKVVMGIIYIIMTIILSFIWGARGIILGNVLNMMMRFVYNVSWSIGFWKRMGHPVHWKDLIWLGSVYWSGVIGLSSSWIVWNPVVWWNCLVWSFLMFLWMMGSQGLQLIKSVRSCM